MDIKDRSTDKFDKELNASFEQQMKQLTALYNTNEPPAQLSWTRFQLQIRQKNLVSQKQQRRTLHWLRPRPRASRLALATGLLVFFLLLSGFAYVAINLGALNSIFHAEPASQQLLQANQFTTLQQSQMADGHKVTLDKAYADANRIILGILVTDPRGTKQPTGDNAFLSNLNAITLKTQQSQALSLLGTQSAVDTSNPQAYKEGLAVAFDGAAIQGDPAHISLNLTIGAECNDAAPSACKYTLMYRFTLPFHAGRLIRLHQTVIANGHTLTLEQVIITPSETRLFIHWQKGDLQLPAFALPEGPAGPATYTETLYDLQLSANGQTYPICQVGGGIPCRSGFGPGPDLNMSQFITDTGGSFTGPILLNGNQQIVGFSLFQPLSHQHGTWTLTITKFVMPTQRDEQGGYRSTASPSKDDSAAPWIFTFNVS
jgi:hypothetical protein